MSSFEKFVLIGLRLILWRLNNLSYSAMNDKERKFMADTHIAIETSGDRD